MRKFISLFFLICALTVFAKDTCAYTLLLSKGSIKPYPNYISQGWKFSAKDSASMSMLSFDDCEWEEVNTNLLLSDTSKISFNGIGWFRLHFLVDTSMEEKLLSMTMKHFGASEIYIDGKKIKSFGKINDADHSEYYDPQEIPFIFMVPAAGEHVLAVHYANFNAEKNFKTYRNPMAGFEMMISDNGNQINNKNLRNMLLSFSLMLCGIFLALGLIHFFLYLYNKTDFSNLFFSIFVFSVASLFVIEFIEYTSTTPSLELRSMLLINPMIIVACVSLAGFIKVLFAKKKWRFLFLMLLGVVALAMSIIGNSTSMFLTIFLIISVSFDSGITIIFGMIKRVKGAHIIGTGILFSILFILTIFTIAMTTGEGFDLNESNTGGQILILFLGLAILSIPVSMSLYQAWRFASINTDLGLQLIQVKILSQKTLEQEQEKQQLLETKKEELEREVIARTSELRQEKKKSDDLLLNILPAEIAEELKSTGVTKAKDFAEVTVLFTDFKNFTMMSEKLKAQELVNEIDYCYSAFDNIITKHGIEKIKTIGDSYMCAGGLPVPNKSNAEDTVRAALEILEFMDNEKQKRIDANLPFFEIRIGCSSGPVIAGIVGIKKFAYDIWGDTVNIASKMESSGEAGKINISGSTYELIKDTFKCVYRGKMEAKNKGMIDMYFVERG